MQDEGSDECETNTASVRQTRGVGRVCVAGSHFLVLNDEVETMLKVSPTSSV